jgi:hypothetical protein
LEEELDKDTVCHQFCLNYTANTLPRKLWKDLETLNRPAIIQTVKYADELVLLATEEKVLQDMIDKLIETGNCYEMEMIVEKTKSNEIFKTSRAEEYPT